ncbi:hypothetical protein PFICI_03491 [Pestalotiopsis fici W106-1]|uniref:Uncharacterized protein n=1 Tax=Pestalotiopsis fici (strain W106-1 / CGMCC3.15140) TaxID=1229662 RepID=W3XJN1_PESFW|nr:uncharacterized protein PFICI_03491 [Pestalotiopsis fici W106-1]ETS85466.1 hypothetical protein PFICI_03491 [Pestalotiopsis fici W106-1]
MSPLRAETVQQITDGLKSSKLFSLTSPQLLVVDASGQKTLGPAESPSTTTTTTIEDLEFALAARRAAVAIYQATIASSIGLPISTTTAKPLLAALSDLPLAPLPSSDWSSIDPDAPGSHRDPAGSDNAYPALARPPHEDILNPKRPVTPTTTTNG